MVSGVIIEIGVLPEAVFVVLGDVTMSKPVSCLV